MEDGQEGELSNEKEKEKEKKKAYILTEPTLKDPSMFDVNNEEHLTTGNAEAYVKYILQEYRKKGYRDTELWEHFYENFEEWDKETFELVSKKMIADFRDFLRK